MKVGQLLRAIEGYDGQTATHAALKLAPYLFVRPGELRAAEWSEFTLDRREWRIPAERMEMGELHILPLARQAVAILRDLKPHAGDGRYVFPAIGKRERSLSENTLNAALRRLGYAKEEMTAHGFRSVASALLNEQGWNADLIELQLEFPPKIRQKLVIDAGAGLLRLPAGASQGDRGIDGAVA